MWHTVLNNLSQCFSATLVSYDAAPFLGLSEHHLLGDMLTKQISNSRRTVTQWDVGIIIIVAAMKKLLVFFHYESHNPVRLIVQKIR